MATLYKPVLIESAEQAEALTIGTVATLSEDIGDGVADFYAATKAEEGWERTDTAGPSWMSPTPDAGMVGWTTLVPIEAEEEYAVRLGSEGGMILPAATHEPAPGHGGVNNLAHLTRHVTPWEEA